MKATNVEKSSPACKSLQLFLMSYLYRCLAGIVPVSAMCARSKWHDIMLEQARAGFHRTDHVKKVGRTTTGLSSDF
jgi:hypothetical protein